MAKRNNCCVLGVLHAKKDPEDVSYAISGSDQWVAKARSYLYLETCPNASDVAVCQQVDASYSDTVNAKIRFGIRECVGDDGNTFPVRVVVETAPTDDTAQDYLDLKNVMKEDRTDPVVREAMAEWMHAAVHLNGNHILTRELFHQAESKNPGGLPRSSERLSRWPAWGRPGRLNAAAVPSSTLRIHPNTRVRRRNV